MVASRNKAPEREKENFVDIVKWEVEGELSEGSVVKKEW
jgi:hypothetical protein